MLIGLSFLFLMNAKYTSFPILYTNNNNHYQYIEILIRSGIFVKYFLQINRRF